MIMEAPKGKIHNHILMGKGNQGRLLEEVITGIMFNN